MPGIAKNSALSEAQSMIEQQASQWFVRMHSDACTKSDVEEHQQWLDADLAHLNAYRELEKLWGVAGDFSGKREINVARQQAKQINQPFSTKVSTLWLDFSRWSSLGLAACLVVALVGSGQLLNISWLDRGLSIIFSNPVHETAVGEQKTLTLSDGSILLLDTQTRVKVDFTGELRRVVLVRGQARFDVASDKKRPFVVQAGDGEITAIGTAFVVKKNDNKTLVTLIEGIVAVTPDTPEVEDISSVGHPEKNKLSAEVQKIELYAGQQVAYSKSGLTAARLVDVKKETSWERGRLVFSEYTLAEVIEELNRYSHSKIILGDTSLAQKRVTGVFRSRETVSAIKTLQAYFLLDVTIDKNGNHVLSSKL